MNRLVSETRVALRSFRRTPTFTATVVLVLAVGIGLTSAIVTVFEAVLLRPLPVADEDRIIVPRVLDQSGVAVALWPELLERFRNDSQMTRDVAGVAVWGAVASPLGDGDDAVTLRQARVTGNFFSVLGARAIIGRMLTSEDDRVGAAPVIVLSYAMWQGLGGDASILERRLLNPYTGWSYEVVGVAPPGLDYPNGADAWVPTTPLGRTRMNVVGRLAPHATAVAAGADLLGFLEQADPATAALVNAGRTEVLTFRQAILGDERLVLFIVTAAVGLLLVVACANVGTLLLLRTHARTREFAIRRSLGARLADVGRQLLLENVILAVIGGVLGFVLATVLLRILIALAPAQLPRLDMIRLGGSPVAVTSAISMLTLLCFGVVPALVGARVKAGLSSRIGTRSGVETVRRRHVRQALVVSQVALAFVMLAGAGLLIRSLYQLQQARLGYAADHLSFMSVQLPYARYNTGPKILAAVDAILARVRAVPGVSGFTPVLAPPFQSPDTYLLKVHVEGQAAPTDEAAPLLPMEAGGSEYFQTLRIPIIRGRGFLESDRENTPRVVVVSESAARALWPGEDPIGRRIRQAFAVRDTAWLTVVGVAGDIRYRRLQTPTPIPTLYVPWRQYVFTGDFAVRASGDIGAVMPAIRRAVGEADPQFKVWSVRTMDDLLAVPLARPRVSALLLAVFGIAALVLSSVGLYGVMASAVREQARDIGVRMALGATPGQIRQGVLTQAFIVIAVGSVVGVAGSLVGSRAMRTLLFEVAPSDPIALICAAVLLIGVGLLAAYVPARWATRVDPAWIVRDA